MASTTKIKPIRIVEPTLPKHSKAVFLQRYVKTDEEGKPVETVGEMYLRVARALAEPERKWVPNGQGQIAVNEYTHRFYKILTDMKFMPAGRSLFEAGNTHTGLLSSCFVVPIEDSLTSIFTALKDAAIIQRSGGGTGFNFSNIRPAKSSVKGIPGIAAGPIHYIKTFDQAFSELLQGSKRHGANIAILSVDHPSILEFINLKGKASTLINFNISVGLTDDFMNRVIKNQKYELLNPSTGRVEKKLSARYVFDLLVSKAWECADPGVIFLDRLAEGNTVPGLGTIEATNPCGEQPLLPYEACNLGHILPHEHVKNGKIDWRDMENTIRLATRFMDNMIEINKLPLPQIDEMVKKTRKAGIGIMGLAHLFYILSIPYNSDNAIALGERVMKFVYETAFNESTKLAKERGVFPAWKKSIYYKRGIKLRNAALTTVAPTGTISIAANTSSGIEPVFSLVTKRRMFWEKEKQDEFLIVDPILEETLRKNRLYSKKLLAKIAENGSIQDIKEIPEKIRKVFVVAYDIEPGWHVKMQAAIQKHVDASVSKTINFSSSATVKDVEKAYLLAWRLGCKGITVYRDQSKSDQVLSAGK